MNPGAVLTRIRGMQPVNFKFADKYAPRPLHGSFWLPDAGNDAVHVIDVIHGMHRVPFLNQGVWGLSGHESGCKRICQQRRRPCAWRILFVCGSRMTGRKWQWQSVTGLARAVDMVGSGGWVHEHHKIRKRCFGKKGSGGGEFICPSAMAFGGAGIRQRRKAAVVWPPRTR